MCVEQPHGEHRWGGLIVTPLHLNWLTINAFAEGHSMSDYTSKYDNLLGRLGNAARGVLGDRRPDTRKVRLENAMIEMSALMKPEIPPEQHDMWEDLWKAMRRVPGNGEGSIAASIAVMTDDEIQKWCDTVVLVYLNILERCYYERP
jgi:hypothetical protein